MFYFTVLKTQGFPTLSSCSFHMHLLQTEGSPSFYLFFLMDVHITHQVPWAEMPIFWQCTQWRRKGIAANAEVLENNSYRRWPLHTPQHKLRAETIVFDTTFEDGFFCFLLYEDQKKPKDRLAWEPAWLVIAKSKPPAAKSSKNMSWQASPTQIAELFIETLSCRRTSKEALTAFF